MAGKHVTGFGIALLLAISLALALRPAPEDDGSARSIAAEGDGTVDTERAVELDTPDSSAVASSAPPAESRPAETDEIIATGYFSCSPYGGAATQVIDWEEHQRQARRNARRWSAALQDSEDADLLFAAALLADPQDEHYIERLLRAFTADPASPAVLERLLTACSYGGDKKVCEELGLEQRAIKAGGDNGAMWGAIAGYRLNRNDVDGALAALRQAASAGTHNEYFIDYVQALELGLAAVSGAGYGERIDWAIGRAAGLLSWTTRIYNACTETAVANSLWRDACLSLGRSLETRSQTLVSRGLGLGLQASIAGRTGDLQLRAELELRQRGFSQYMESIRDPDMQLILARDNRVMGRYIDEYVAHGEVAAVRFAKSETERLKQVPGYDPCQLPPPRLPGIDE